MVLKIVERGQHKDIKIKEGEASVATGLVFMKKTVKLKVKYFSSYFDFT